MTSTSPNSWLGTLRRDFGAAVQVAQRHHVFHETRRINKLKNIATPEPEPAARAAQARREQKQLAEIETNVRKIADESFMTRAKLKPIDYSKSSMVDAFHRQEIRSLLRSMPEAQRIAAMKKYSFREAALETVAEVSGLPESVHEQLMQQTLREKFPDEIASTEAAAEGVEVCETALKAARAAVEAELLAVGEPIIEGPAPAPVKAWA